MDEKNLIPRMLLFNTLFKELDDAYRSAAAYFDLPECALWILYSLRLSPQPPTQKELCGMMFQSKQSINTALKKLIADGYVLLEADSQNRRFKRIRLTESGRNLAAQTADRIIHAEQNAFSQGSIAELDEFLRLFKKYSQGLILCVNHCTQNSLSESSSQEEKDT